MGSSPCYVASFSRFKQVINLMSVHKYCLKTRSYCRRRFKIHPSTRDNDKITTNSTGADITVKTLSKTIVQYLTFLLLFPLMPIFLFIRILWNDGEESKEDSKEVNSRRLSLKLAEEVSTIYITIESSLQTILTLWLILRGIIRLKIKHLTISE